MGFSKTPAEMVSKIARSVEATTTGNKGALADVSHTAERVMDGSIAEMTGGKMLMRNAPNERKPRVMSAKAGRVQGTVVAECIVGPKGPVPLIENGARPHPIGEGRGAAGGGWTGSGSEVLVIPDEDVVRWGPFIHPGTAGRGQWKRARDGLPRVLGPAMLTNAAQRALRPFR